MTTLADRIEQHIRDIPANNPGFISVRQETLSDLLSRELLRRIAEVAANAALTTGDTAGERGS